MSKNGKVTAKKKGSAVVKVKVGNRTLKCKVTVKDTRKNTSNKPVTCQHKWVKQYVDEEVTVMGCQCACGEVFGNQKEWQEHRMAAAANHEYGHGGYSDYEITTTVTKTYEYCEKCGVKKQ